MDYSKGKKQKILIVDDSELNRSILADILEKDYEILEAADGIQAIELIQKYELDIELVLLDIIMPHMDGFEVLNIMNQKHWIEEIPVIVISAENGSQQIERAYNLGVIDFIMRPFDALIVYHRVVNTILLYAKQKKMMSIIAEQIEEKEKRSNMMVDILSHIVEFRNGESNQHIIRIRTFTEVMLRQLQKLTNKYDLTQSKIALISLASALHDIGKIAIDEKILNKPGRLTKEEFEVMKTHSAIGAQMIKDMPQYQENELLRISYEICRWHHERIDGRGYPDGLAGDDIPISAQIVSLADVYDALVSERCYKKAFSHETAIQMIMNGECGKFSPLLLECLKNVEGTLDSEFTYLQAEEKKLLQRELLNEILQGENEVASKRVLYLLDEERKKYDNFSQITSTAQFEYIASSNVLTISDWGAQMLHLDKAIVNPLENEQLLKLIDKKDIENIVQLIKNANKEVTMLQYECVFHFNDMNRWHRINLQTKWTDNNLIDIIGNVVDIQDDKSKIESLEEQANHDSATNLLNHTSAKRIILNQMHENQTDDFALIIFDFDNFKSINDTYGHIFGDAVIKYIAEKVKNCTDSEDVVARIGGDEFLIFFRCQEDVEKKVKRILDNLIGNYEGLFISVTFGVALTSTVGKDYSSLLYAADQALYTAKRMKDKHYLIYNDTMKETLSKTCRNLSK